MELKTYILERRKIKNFMLEIGNCSNALFSSRHPRMELKVPMKLFENLSASSSVFCGTVKAASDA